MMKKIYIATDHAGFTLKESVKKFLQSEGFNVEDFGAFEYVPTDDYPDFISKVGEAISKDSNSLGIVFGRSGEGEAMVANKFPNVRAALFYGTVVPVQPVEVNGRTSADPYEIIRLTRQHNGANVLSLGASFLTDEEACKVVKIWIDTPVGEEERHLRRIEKIRKIEQRV